MRRLLVSLVIGLVLCGVAATHARADEAWGKWNGGIEIAGQRLAVMVSLAKDRSTIDVPAQHAIGLPLSDVKVAGDDVGFTLAVPGGPAVFKGKLDAAAGTIKGDFTQNGGTYQFSLVRAVDKPRPSLPPLAVKDAGPLVGDWTGSIAAGKTQIAIDLAVSTAKDVVVAGLSVPSQCLDGVPVNQMSLDATGKLYLEVDAPFGVLTFDGAVDKEGIKGTYTQGGSTSPFTLGHAPAPPERPYTEEQVTYKDGDVTLAATLSLPKGVAHPPVVVTITGSGPQNRDECVVGVRPFAAVADQLARHGIAVLRSDDRGVGASTGDSSKAVPTDFAADASAAIAYLRTRGDVDPKRVGLLGHSEGGIIGPMVAAQDPSVAFVVMMAGPGETLDQIIIEQSALISRAEGVPEDQIKSQAAISKAMFASLRVRKTSDLAKLKAEWKKIVEKNMSADMIAKSGGVDAILAQPERLFASDWFRFYLTYDPLATLAKLHCPVLALNGTLDLQVPYKTNLPLIKRALEKGKNKDFKIVELPGLNHLFQRATTGSPSEYATLPPTMDPAALDVIVTWVTEHTRS